VRAASGPLGQPGHLVNSQSEQLQIVIKLDNIPIIQQSQALTETERKSKAGENI
jgi:hypothetical protein